MYCSKCGIEINENNSFCPKCGINLQNESKNLTPNDNTALWESTSEIVSPDLENITIDVYESFGWELRSSQTVDNKDTHLENRFGTIYSVTESTNYVKLTFRRNKALPRINELRELEDEYQSYESPRAPDSPNPLLLIGGILLLCTLTLFSGLGAIGIILLVIYFVKKFKYEKELKVYSSLAADNILRRDEILEKAKAIIDNI
ncbi:MAG: zinc ribbon domain-containing protein [Ruminococcaceae bacterium]|nr:zinc ribbon domain-containing protein [Oscillospiraceae bacterium]